MLKVLSHTEQVKRLTKSEGLIYFNVIFIPKMMNIYLL